MKKKYLILFIVLFTSQGVFSKNAYSDSLISILSGKIHDTLRCRILNELISTEGDDNIWPKYNEELTVVAKRNIQKNDKFISLYNSYYALALNNTGYIYKQNGNISQSFSFFKQAYDIQKELNDEIGMAGSLLNLGYLFRQQGNIIKALEYYHQALKIQIKIDNKNGIATSYNNIGYVYELQKEFSKALDYYNKSVNIYKEVNDLNGIAICYNNISSIYRSHGDPEIVNDTLYSRKVGLRKAVELLNQAILLQEKIDYKEDMAASINCLGEIYENAGDPFCDPKYNDCKNKSINTALDYYTKSLNLRIEINNKSGIALSYSTLGSFYFYQNNLEKAEYYSLKALKDAKELGYIEIIMDAAEILKKIYEKKGQAYKALSMYELFVQMKDSIFNLDLKKATYKKELEIEYELQATKDSIRNEAKLKEEKLIHKQEIIKQRFFTLGGIIGFILMLIIAIISYRAFKNKKKANELLNQQKEEIAAQRDIVFKQKEEIEEIHKEVTDSINYARRIQEAVLPISNEALSVLGEHFILFRPKDIVSGDFYWIAKIERTLIVAVADCTGHGVPGAFMSMLGISFLNEIIRKKEILKASEALNELRKEIINALQQTGNLGEQKDGMDMSLIAIKPQEKSQIEKAPNPKLQNQRKENDEFLIKSEIEHQTSNFKPETSNIFEVQWAGANNPLWIVSSGALSLSKCSKFEVSGSTENEQTALANIKHETSNMKLFELKPDKMPIAIYECMEEFTNHELQLNPGDILYLMSDGYEDQFGGPKGKKFLSKNLKQLLISNCQLPMHEQKQILEKTLIEWIGEGEQIDDITILGIKI